jgi:hypothetical protein
MDARFVGIDVSKDKLDVLAGAVRASGSVIPSIMAYEDIRSGNKSRGPRWPFFVGARQLRRTAHKHSGPGNPLGAEGVSVMNLRLNENRVRTRFKLRNHFSVQHQARIIGLHLKVRTGAAYLRATRDTGDSWRQTVSVGKGREYWVAREDAHLERRRTPAIFNRHYRGRHAAGHDISNYRISYEEVSAQFSALSACLVPRQITQ